MRHKGVKVAVKQHYIITLEDVPIVQVLRDPVIPRLPDLDESITLRHVGVGMILHPVVERELFRIRHRRDAQIHRIKCLEVRVVLHVDELNSVKSHQKIPFSGVFSR